MVLFQQFSFLKLSHHMMNSMQHSKSFFTTGTMPQPAKCVQVSVIVFFGQSMEINRYHRDPSRPRYFTMMPDQSGAKQDECQVVL